MGGVFYLQECKNPHTNPSLRTSSQKWSIPGLSWVASKVCQTTRPQVFPGNDSVCGRCSGAAKNAAENEQLEDVCFPNQVSQPSLLIYMTRGPMLRRCHFYYVSWVEPKGKAFELMYLTVGQWNDEIISYSQDGSGQLSESKATTWRICHQRGESSHVGKYQLRTALSTGSGPDRDPVHNVKIPSITGQPNSSLTTEMFPLGPVVSQVPLRVNAHRICLECLNWSLLSSVCSAEHCTDCRQLLLI